MVSIEGNIGLLMIVTCFLVNHCGSSCIGKSVLRSGGISCEEKQIILDEHNRLRQLVALGQIHGQPSAANMMEMIWDDELAAIAQRWADSCAESHDSLRNVRRFAVGQNIARSWTTRPPGPYDGEPNWRRQISGWFNEVQYYHSGYSKATGHYTQLVWGDTFLLGCGYSFYYDPARGYTKNYVCNYGPSGNVLGFQPYKSGEPACGNYGMSYSNRYSGLCLLGLRVPLASGGQKVVNQCTSAHNDPKDREISTYSSILNVQLAWLGTYLVECGYLLYKTLIRFIGFISASIGQEDPPMMITAATTSSMDMR